MTERLVVVGNGMVSLRFLERLRDHAPDRFDVTVIGQEAAPAYNRVLLSSLLAREIGLDGCELRPLGWYADGRVRLRVGRAAEAIDRGRRRVRVGGEDIPYDWLVLATGSEPITLPIPGADLPGATTFRDLAHVEAMQALPSGAPAVVIGGGLLGLEAAAGLAGLGIGTTLLHVMDRLMERQLDGPAAGLVLQAIERRGVRVRLGAQTAAIEGDGRVERVRLADGTIIGADVVVTAIGTRPRSGLARDAGLAVGRGIVVGDDLATSDPAVFAIGECAEHRGRAYGLVEPGYEQAAILARRLGGDRDATYRGSAIVTSLKVSGLGVFSAGDIEGTTDEDDLTLADPGAGVYRRLRLRDDRLVGAILVGDVGDGSWYRELIAGAAPVAAARGDLMFGPRPLAA